MMEWNSNQSRLPYHLYTYRKELRRRRRREGVLKETKTAITDQLVMNNIEEFYQIKREETAQITEVDIELDDSAVPECHLNEKEDCENTNAAECFSNVTNTNCDFSDVLKYDMITSNNSNLTKNNECIVTNLSDNLDNVKTNAYDGNTNYTHMNWDLDDMLKEIENEEIKTGNNFSNTKNDNECIDLNYDYSDERYNDFNNILNGVFQNDSELETNTNSTKCDASTDLYMALEDFNNYYINL